MPKENQKRGRWGEKKRKRDDPEESDSRLKRHKSNDGSRDSSVDVFVNGESGDKFSSFGVKPTAAEDETTFYGFLTDEEQAYYANVNNKLDANDFESDEDRANFIGAVHRESQGKEIKIASSQSSSRYLEKIILLSNAEQLKGLFEKFLESLTYLVQHRFGSHCCEMLFIQAARFVGKGGVSRSENGTAGQTTMEEYFLKAAEELKPNMGFLLTERFASHSVRVLLLVLSGEPLQTSSNKVMLASRKKEKVEILRNVGDTILDEKRSVPRSFEVAMSGLIAAAISTLDTTYLRALATHPTGNPMLQLLLRLELTQTGKPAAKDDSSLLRRLLPDETLEEDSESARFVQGLLYDPAGSHLIETLVQHLPGKTFKKLYRNLLQKRMGDLAKNDVASYVAIKVLERLSKDDLEVARDLILPEVPALVARYRVGLIKVLVERCHVRHVDMELLVQALREAYGHDADTRLLKMLKLDTAPEGRKEKAGKDGQETQEERKYATDLHGSLLAQSMLQAPDVCELIHESLLVVPESTLITLAKNSTASRVIQVALTAEPSSLQFRRQLISRFYGHLAELSIDSAGSHVADALWTATNGSHFIKERLALELSEKEILLRESRYGRSVWKNWSMDMYKRRFREWQAQAKGYDQEHSQEQAKEQGERKKSAIELAREKHAAKKARGFPKKRAEWASNVSKAATSSNRTPLGIAPNSAA